MAKSNSSLKYERNVGDITFNKMDFKKKIV